MYDKLIDVIDNGAQLDRSIADAAVAAGMKQWAGANGVTHYTHWFQPLTEETAEKHDAFTEHDGKGGMIEEFSGKLLVSRSLTHPASPPAVSARPLRHVATLLGILRHCVCIDDTLCIPTIFISYTGEALDYEAPLLRALHAVNVAATDVCHSSPDVNQQLLGWDRYYLVDRGSLCRTS